MCGSCGQALARQTAAGADFDPQNPASQQVTVATVTVTGATRAQAKGSDVTGDRGAGAHFPHIVTLQAFEEKLEENQLVSSGMVEPVTFTSVSLHLFHVNGVTGFNVLRENRRRCPRGWDEGN